MIYRNKAAVAVVNKEIGAQGGGGEVVDAAGAVGDVSEDEDGGDVSEGGEDVGDGEGVEEEALGELEGHALGAHGEYAPHRFVDFEGVVGRQEGDGGV